MSNTSVITKVLRQLGHEIDHRIVDVEEQGLPQKYDIALVGLAIPQSLSSRYVYGALWTVSQFGADRVKFYVDDWLLHQMQSQLQSGLKNPQKRFYSLSNRHGFEAAKKYTEVWIEWFKFLASSKYKLLIPAFPWAKIHKLLPKLPNVTGVIFDPTPLALVDPEVLCGSSQPVNLTCVSSEQRERKWILAAMRDVSPWIDRQQFSWPVERYGNKRIGQPIVTERELLDKYCQAWGVMGAPYEAVMDGGGWRARYVHSAVTDSILFLDPQEARTAGRPYDVYRSIVENATVAQLEETAAKQKKYLLDSTWSLDQLISNLNAYVCGEVVRV